MAYFVDLFSPETYEAFSESDRTITGFRPRQRRQAQRVEPGDMFFCYLTRLSRWMGLLRVEGYMFEDEAPIFVPKEDPFSVRFRVRPLIWLSLDHAVPIHDDVLWPKLSFTQGLPKNSTAWTGQVRGSLAQIQDNDAEVLRSVLEHQESGTATRYSLSADDRRKLRTRSVHVAPNRALPVSIPTHEEESQDGRPLPRESFNVQASLCSVGERMGFRIWLPKADRTRVFEHWKPEANTVLDTLPLNYDEATLNTVERIDVLWLRRRTIVRAFEVEHTTSIYSGILRMADLLALQPNIEIKAHIVAPPERREKVMQELTRPVFTLLEGRPLSSACTYLPYDAISALASEKHLEHMSDSIVDSFIEEAEPLDL